MASRHFGFAGPTGSRSIQSASPEDRTLESNRKSIGGHIPEIDTVSYTASDARCKAGVAVYKLYDAITDIISLDQPSMRNTQHRRTLLQ